MRVRPPRVLVRFLSLQLWELLAIGAETVGFFNLDVLVHQIWQVVVVDYSYLLLGGAVEILVGLVPRHRLVVLIVEVVPLGVERLDRAVHHLVRRLVVKAIRRELRLALEVIGATDVLVLDNVAVDAP